MKEIDKVAGWYAIILFLLPFAYVLYNLISFLVVEISEGFGKGEFGLLAYVALIYLIVILAFFAFCIFLGFKIKKGMRWAKITALVIFALIIFVSIFYIVMGILNQMGMFGSIPPLSQELFGFFVLAVVLISSIVGIILVSLSLKSS